MDEIDLLLKIQNMTNIFVQHVIYQLTVAAQ